MNSHFTVNLNILFYKLVLFTNRHREMREAKMRKNKGYTLVELLVAMVVLVIVLMEVYMVMNSGSKVYEHGSIDVALQTEAQQTILELEDLIIDVNSDIIYTPPGGGVSEPSYLMT